MNMNELKEEYKHLEEEAKIVKENNNKILAKEKKEILVKENLPEYIYPIIEENKIRGYYVYGILDNNGNKFPRRDCIEKTNRWNLNEAKLYIEMFILIYCI